MVIFKRYMAFVVSALTFSKDSCPFEANDKVVHMELGCRKLFPTAFGEKHHEKLLGFL